MHFTLTILTLLYVIFLIVPGILFQKVYFSDVFKKQYSSGVFADRLVVSVFLGLAIQSLSVYINLKRHNYFNSTDFTIKSVYEKLKFSHKGLAENTLPNISDNDIQIFIFQIIISLLLTIFLGYIFRLIVIWFRLDLRNSFFKVKDDWNYIFTDKERRFDFTNHIGNRRFLGTRLNILTRENKNEIYLYSGHYYDHTFKTDGELETVMIRGASKHYEYDPKSPEKAKIDYIPGSLFIIPYSNILNINIQYEYESTETNKRILNTAQNILIITYALVCFAPLFIIEISLFRKLAAALSFLLSSLPFAIILTIIKERLFIKKNKEKEAYKGFKLKYPNYVSVIIMFSILMLGLTSLGLFLLKIF